MSTMQTLPVKGYRVMNDWTTKTLLETRDFDEAVEFKEAEERRNDHDEILLIAIIEA